MRLAAKMSVIGFFALANPGAACAGDTVAVFYPEPPYERCDGFNKGSETGKAVFRMYVLGYLSGAASALGDDGFRGMKAEEVESYIDRYCIAHPENHINKLTTEMFKSHAGRK